MDADFKREVEARLASAEEDLKINEAENARLKRLVQALHDVLAMLDHQVPPPTSGLGLLVESYPMRGQKPVAAMSIREGAKTLLERDGPKTTRELLVALLAAGKRVGGRSPIDTLRATLQTYDIFKRTSDAKWDVVRSSEQSPQE